MKWLRRLGYVLLVLIIIGVPAYYWLISESHAPADGVYAIDMAQVRRLADSLPGEKPGEIRVETVAHFRFPKTFVVAGDGWQPADMPVSSYQLVYPGHTVIIDTAFNATTDNSPGLASFDAEAYGRMSTALDAASLIIITHEHLDHLGGLLAQSNLSKLLTVARLTKEQIDHPERTLPAKWPAGVLANYHPLEYEHYLAIAPGVVLIKAPGHTPGSQMVYVKRADGAEILFLGDVAWQHRNIDVQRERARLMTQFLIKEDRDAVMRQLAELKRLQQADPRLEMMPGHDAEALQGFLTSGLLIKNFK